MIVRSKLIFVLTFSTLLASTAYAQIEVWRKIQAAQGLIVGINPVNPATIYAQGANSALYVSRDRGVTWSQATPTGLPAQLRSILIHPRDTLTLFIVSFSSGLWRSTDAGATWNTVLTPFGIDGESVSYDPIKPDTMYAGNFSNARVYRSIDRGATWAYRGRAGAETELCALAVRPDSTEILYAGTGGGTISKSTNGGINWRLVKTGGSAEIPRIVINPKNPMIAYGTGYAGNQNFTGVWKTTDGGENWFLTGLKHVSVWGMEIDPLHPETLYAGSFSEFASTIYRTTDGGTSWTPLNRGLLTFNSVWSLKIDLQDPQHVYAAITSGDFGFNGVFKLSNANAGIEGTVISAYNSQPITTGYMHMLPTAVTTLLDQSLGKYSSYRYAPDTTTSLTANVYINSTLFHQQKLTYSDGVVTTVNLPVQPGQITGTVYNDLNRNGSREEGEPGVSNWIVQISGAGSATTVTDENGIYAFHNLFPGTYTTAEQARYGWTQSAPSPPTYSLTINASIRTHTSILFGNYIGNRVLSVSPGQNATGSARLPMIQVSFDTAMDPTKFNDTVSWKVRGSLSGRHRGTFQFSEDHETVIFTPDEPFQPGELVSVDVSKQLRTTEDFAITPFNLQFTVASPTGGMLVPKVDYTVGNGPWGITAGDLNKDGYNDLLAVSYNAQVVSVLMNNGDGTFAPRVDYSTGTGPRSIALADFDNDGDLDVVTGNSGFSNISVLYNNGNGILSTRTDYSAGSSPVSVSPVDVDGDGLLDVLVGNGTSSSVSVVRNNGSGGFHSPTLIPAGSAPWHTFTADVNNDGGVDVLVVNSTSTSSISILRNLGQGQLSPPTALPALAFARNVTAIDLDGDGRVELIATNSNSSSISIYPQVSNGVFGSRIDIPTAAFPWGIASGDIDGDGMIDLLVTSTSTRTLSVFRNLGAFAFSRIDQATGPNPVAIAVADLDNDGDLDVAVANSGANTVSVFMNGVMVSTSAGWNLVSIPVRAQNASKQSLFPTSSSRAFRYEGTYVPTDTLKVGYGYWVKFDSTQNLSFNGAMVDAETIRVGRLWNLIGSLTKPVGVSSIVTDPPGIISSNFFGFNSGYIPASTLEPGKGYWIRTSDSGSIILNVNSAFTPKGHQVTDFPGNLQENYLRIEDKIGRRQSLYLAIEPQDLEDPSLFDLPPVPPEGLFDIRFNTGRYLEYVSLTAQREIGLSISAAYPIKLEWNWSNASLRGSLILGSDTRVSMDSRGSYAIDDPNTFLSLLIGANNLIPREFVLDQNHPNPFNPSTEIRYGLPSRSRVRLTVIDLLGQIVEELVDEEQQPGYHTARWQGNVSSGIYFYRLEATNLDEPGRSIVQTRKMILLR